MDFNEPSWQHESTVCASLRVVAESCVRSHAQTQEQNNKTNHLDKTLLKFLQPQILLSPENIYNINALKIIAGSNQSCPLVWVFTRAPTPTPCFLVPPSSLRHPNIPTPSLLIFCWHASVDPGPGLTGWGRSRLVAASVTTLSSAYSPVCTVCHLSHVSLPFLMSRDTFIVLGDCSNL